MSHSEEKHKEKSALTNNDINKEKNADLPSENSEHHKYLIYGVNDSPPIHITIVCALQQGLLSLSTQLIVSLLVAEAVCASDKDIFKARLLSSTLFMSGVTTLAMNIFGIRLPLFQGAMSEYVVPLLLVGSVEGSFCSTLAPVSDVAKVINTSANSTGEDISMDRILWNVRALQGSLMLAGVIHALLGFTGLIGVLLKLVGPLTIVPTMVLLFIFIVKPVLKFVEVNWGIAMSTVFVAVILFLYLANYNMPIPIWTPSAGFRIIRYPLHQILISIILNWLLCGLLTKFGVFPDDPKHPGFNARTDARISIIRDHPWFTFPYPGQYGPIGFSETAFLSCMIATLISVLDSIGDYYACAKVCRVPPPPRHAVNRGLLVEGLCTFLSGTVGCGHATGTYGGNIGAVGVTRVASRQVFIGVGVLYVLFGIFGKFSAMFITIPSPVLGGAIVVMFGIFFGVVLSNLEVTNMSSPRNMAIIGLSIFIGLSVPTWVQQVVTPIHSGNEKADRIIAMLLGNPTLVGTTLACFLDNTVPGSAEDRGMAAWHVSDDDETAELDTERYNEGFEVYDPLLPKRLLSLKLMKVVPFLPYKRLSPKVNDV
ncbi:solute carrier family 23 member 2-like isoform X2 [Mercenaria mercenaria]|uniref:solute carrier family 23 member 2-like isoform X2 n=1 Tax=Mercenaria mercenaria TaxID=6596 RepID=UPI00234EA5DF|nr:solute carrier family 23 member 2-like isoform X2 [Mercenaria mercenaria]